MVVCSCLFLFKQKTAYEMRISDWSSDVCSSDLRDGGVRAEVWDFWAQNSADCFLVVGLDAAPHPYSMLTLDLASIAGRECRRQLRSEERRVGKECVSK